MIRLLRSKIVVALSLLVFMLLIGITGYKILADFTWIEALYMTVITVTTVGFSEIKPLDTPTRVFTIILIVTSIFIAGFALSVVTEYILGKNALQHLKKKKLKKNIEALSNHVIICGFGRNGRQAAKRLTTYQKPFVVVEERKEIIASHENEVLFVEGNAEEDSVLIAAGIHRAHYLIAAVPDDATNLFIVLTARQLNRKLFIISRASQASSQKKLEFAGADRVIMPDTIGGGYMASLVVMPDLITFMNQLSLEGEHTANLEAVKLEAFTDMPVPCSINDLNLQQKTGCTVIGYITPDGAYLINPAPDLVLQPQGKIIVLGKPEQIKELNQMFRRA